MQAGATQSPATPSDTHRCCSDRSPAGAARARPGPTWRSRHVEADTAPHQTTPPSAGPPPLGRRLASSNGGPSATAGAALRRVAGGSRRLLTGTRRQLYRGVAAAGEHSARQLWPAFPHAIRLDHPPTAELRPRYGSGRPPHAQLQRLLRHGEERYRAHLQAFSAYHDDLARIALTGESSLEPCWLHPWLIGLDTVSLYAFTRLRRPARYVEIGSGQSTKVVARARADGELTTTITSIDPAPRAAVDQLCDRVVRRALEQADLDECFGQLQAGDMVFFDGSHRVLPNSDCVAFFLDVLPALAPGVLVGIHDVYLPEDYPHGFVELWWSEQYLLAAVLLGGAPWLQVELPAFYASGQPALGALLAPLFDRPPLQGVNRRGSVFWVQTR